MSDQSVIESQDVIAVVGMSCRFPGASNPAEFWENLKNGVESISLFTEEEVLAAGTDRATVNHPGFVRAGGILDGIELFDAPFFGFTPREAEILDPQQRLFLECSWEALEDAGHDTEGFDGLVGVFAGCAMSTYLFNVMSNPAVMAAVGGFQALISNDKDHLATHTCYKLNLRGPGVTVQTACSTSLVAVSLACQSLLDHQCDLALAGGVAIKVPQKSGYVYQDGMIYSPDGHCRPFDAEARGTVSGNGIGIVVLRRLADAIADGDRISAVILSSAINNDGALKVGYTAPSVEGQAEVIALAQAMAGIGPEAISYIETHGTATALGDPIEIAALKQAFAGPGWKLRSCAIGSVKSNLGHLDPAAGVAGLIKATLMLEHKMLPPTLHFEKPNPEIDFDNSPFFVNRDLTPWITNGLPRRAGVSSFGIGGTNAHVVLQEAPEIAASGPSRPEQLLILSARTPSALDAATKSLAAHLRANPDLDIADVAFTCALGRRAMDHRRILVAATTGDATSVLESRDPTRLFTDSVEKQRPVVFMFPGQGTQYVEMAKGLYQTEPIFSHYVDMCSKMLLEEIGVDLRDLLYPATGRTADLNRLDSTEITQPALFAIEYALAMMLREWGIHPKAMIGHSIGEYVAACLSEVFSLEAALHLVAQRGRLISKLPRGAMISVSLSEQEVSGRLRSNLSLAATNGPSTCVVSGPASDIAEFQQRLEDENITCRKLRTSHAFHSRMMVPVAGPFSEMVRQANPRPPKIPYVSNVTGNWIGPQEATDSGYWANHLCQTVRFGAGIRRLMEEPDAVLLEVGPGETLSSLARQNGEQGKQQITLSCLRHPQVEKSDVAFLLNTIGRLWLCGIRVNWRALYKDEQRNRVRLPPYPFERARYWVDPAPPSSAGKMPALKEPDIADWFYIPSWKRTILSRAPTPPETRSPSFLVFADGAGLGHRLVNRLREAGHLAIAVLPGTDFAQKDEFNYVLNPGRVEDYRALIDRIAGLEIGTPRIVHLWTATPRNEGESELELFDRAQESGFYSILYLAQALGALAGVSPVRLTVVSAGVHSVTGDERLDPGRATVLGLCRVIPQEHSAIRCFNIDVDLAELSRPCQGMLESLMAELFTGSADPVVAYRRGHRWVQLYEAVRLAESPAPTSFFRERGTYLITGGLGNIGFALAEEIAKTCQARLVLVGRSVLPAERDWEEWVLNHSEEDPITHKIRRLQALKQVGSEVMAFSADVANEEQMRDVVNRVRETFGEIDGVIHGAGETSSSSFPLVNFADPGICDRHFATKARGLLVLDKLLRGRKRDFWIFLSSLSSTLGGLGYAAYSAANNFLDAFAAGRRRDEGCHCISINWDGWAFAVTNLNADDSGVSAALAQQTILPAEGIEAFRRILSLPDVSQVAVSVSSLPARIDKWVRLESLKPENEGQSSVTTHARPTLANEYVAPSNEVQQAIAAIWQELLGVEDVGIHDNFFELGGHSLLAIQVISRMRQSFHLELAVDLLFNSPTVAKLADVIQTGSSYTSEEIERISELLDFVDTLSEDEIKALLGDQGET